MSGNNRKESFVFRLLILEILFLVPDVATAILANSIAMYAELIRCGIETLAIAVTWFTLRRFARVDNQGFDYGTGKLESMTSVLIAALLLASIYLLVEETISRILDPVRLDLAKSIPAIVYTVLGIMIDAWLWRKSLRMARSERSYLLDSQRHLYRIKTISGAIVLLALVVSSGFPEAPWTVYADPVCSVIMSLFILHSAYVIISRSVYDLADRTLEESLQLIIVRELAAYYEEYVQLYGVKSRKSGDDIYIEIFLEFDGSRSMHEVQSVINRIRQDIEASIHGSSVNVVPTDSNFKKGN